MKMIAVRCLKAMIFLLILLSPLRGASAQVTDAASLNSGGDSEPGQSAEQPGVEPSAKIIESRTGTANPPSTLVVRSAILGEDRNVYVQLPEGYAQSSAHYPVLFVMDAEWLFDLASAHQRYYSFDEVTDQKVPRMIVIGIPNTDRNRDYTPSPESGNELVFSTAGGANEFLRFLELELLPLLEERYRAAPSRAIVGWSFSRLFSAYSAIETPGLFDAHLCISPAIWWDSDLIFNRMKSAKFTKPKRMVFTLGGGEAGGWVYESTTRLVEHLESQPISNLSVSHFEFDGVGHSWGVASAMNKGLQALFADYVAPQEVIEGGGATVDAYYESLSETWGYSVVPTQKVLRALAYREWQSENTDLAVDTLVRAVAEEPGDSTTWFQLCMFHRALGDSEKSDRAARRAIEAEMLKPVPNEVNIRAIRSATGGGASESDPG